VFYRDRVTTRNNLIPGNAAFDRHDLVYESNARMVQLTLRVTF
jgi:hypothetical protein